MREGRVVDNMGAALDLAVVGDGEVDGDTADDAALPQSTTVNKPHIKNINYRNEFTGSDGTPYGWRGKHFVSSLPQNVNQNIKRLSSFHLFIYNPFDLCHAP